MNKLCLITIFCGFLVVISADPERPKKYHEHDATVINCARYSREANQHSCVLSPFSVEGPYFLPDDLERSDITDGETGIPYELTIKLVNSNDCTPLVGMYVHIWHANAIGKYSGVAELTEFRIPIEELDLSSFEVRPTPVNDERFLRGYQISNEDGKVTFKTIIPGWYEGRCLHIHLEVYPKNTTESSDISYIGQIFFQSNLGETLKLIDPYSTNTVTLTTNEVDAIYLNSTETLAELVSVNGMGYKSTMIFGVNPNV